jgi:hypothetical protein
MSETRPVHGLERVWLAADRVMAPFVNQLVVEGHGTLDAAAWSDAVASAARAHPLLCVRVRGVGRWARWQADGAAPRVRTVDGSAWDGTSGDGAPFLRERLDTDAGPVAEVLLVEGPARWSSGHPSHPMPRVVFRSHHAVVDGRAARAFAEDVTRALRGEPPQGASSDAARLPDVEVASRAWPDAARPHAARPHGAAEGSAPPARTLRAVPWGLPPGPPCWVRLDVRCETRELLPRALCALRDAAPGEPLRVSLSVDLAGRAGMPAVDANLSGLAYVEVPAGAVLADVRSAITRAVPLSGGPLRLAHGLRDVPLAWLARAGRAGARRLAHEGVAQEDVTVSNLGRASLDALSGAGFTARRCFWIPPANPGNPLFLSIAGGADTLTLCATACTSDSGRLGRLLGEVGRTLAG